MDEIISLDQQLLLALNGSDSIVLDTFFMAVTRTATWIPLFLFVAYAILRIKGWRELLLVLACTALVVLIADRFSSGLCKPLFHRLRPSHEPSLEGLVDLVGDYRGGLYGFISSHAANTFGVATFITLCLRRKAVNIVCNLNNAVRSRIFLSKVSIALLFAWAVISSYSRIYLGVHYPGDILAGSLCGVITAFLVFYICFTPLARRMLSEPKA